MEIMLGFLLGIGSVLAVAFFMGKARIEKERFDSVVDMDGPPINPTELLEVIKRP